MKTIKVAVMNTSKEITDLLSEVLQDEGFETCATFTYPFKEDYKLFDDYLKINKPDVLVYDVAPPYRENYFLFLKLRGRRSVKNLPIVLTTTNKDALESFVGETATHELIGKPFDLQEIIDAINNAYRKNLSKKMTEKVV